MACENFFLRGASRPPEPLVIGHRGARGMAPENSLAGIHRAAELGADAVELDLQLSHDGVPVVFHDHTLERLTDVRQRFPDRAPWPLANFDRDELATLDLVAPFFATSREAAGRSQAEEADCRLPERVPAWREQGGTIPDLDQVLELLCQLDLGANLEIKAFPWAHPELVPRTLAVLERHDFLSRVVLSSFDHELLRQLKNSRPEVAVGVLTAERLADCGAYLVDHVGADSFHPGVYPGCDVLGLGAAREGLGARPDLRVRELQDRGLRVFPWTANHPKELGDLLQMGVDGVITDFPARLSELRESGPGSRVEEVSTL